MHVRAHPTPTPLAGDVEVEWTVGPVDVSDLQSHEVITRYESAGAAGAGGGRRLVGGTGAACGCRSGHWRRVGDRRELPRVGGPHAQRPRELDGHVDGARQRELLPSQLPHACVESEDKGGAHRLL